MRFPPLAHRSATAHKLHSTTATTRSEFDAGNGETISRLPALAYSSPEAVQTIGTGALHIEKTTAPRITMLWDILAEKDSDGQVKFSDQQVRLNHPPHVTLAVIDDSADPDVLVETLDSIVAGWAPLPILLDAIAILPRKPFTPMRLHDQT
jgi:hypothetical protein